MCPLVLLSEGGEVAGDEGVRCALARETLSAVLDGEASAAEVRTAVKHLRRCTTCMRFVAGVVAITQALRTAHVIEASSAGHRSSGRSV